MTTIIPVESISPTGFRPLAPFGREVEAAVRRGERPNLRVFTGPQGWEKAVRWRDVHGTGAALVLPPDTAPDSLRWPAMPEGVLVDALTLNRSEAFSLARCIASDGTPMVYAICRAFDAVIVRHKGWAGLRDSERRAA